MPSSWWHVIIRDSDNLLRGCLLGHLVEYNHVAEAWSNKREMLQQCWFNVFYDSRPSLTQHLVSDLCFHMQSHVIIAWSWRVTNLLCMISIKLRHYLIIYTTSSKMINYLSHLLHLKWVNNKNTITQLNSMPTRMVIGTRNQGYACSGNSLLETLINSWWKISKELILKIYCS